MSLYIASKTGRGAGRRAFPLQSCGWFVLQGAIHDSDGPFMGSVESLTWNISASWGDSLKLNRGEVKWHVALFLLVSCCVLTVGNPKSKQLHIWLDVGYASGRGLGVSMSPGLVRCEGCHERCELQTLGWDGAHG